jgi:hypothetical protein
MKNLKKLISVIIAVIMLVSSFATVAAADYADVESTNSYYKAIKVLSGLGIAKGDEAGNFNPQNDVKRSEMVAFVCRAMGEEDIATASASSAFTDVAANHWAAGYIAWGVNRGIINGMGDGTFAPDASVTYQDAVVMIMRALGYDRIAQRAENGGYPTGYLKLASQYGVLKDAGYDNAKAATREIIAQLIYNGLTAPLVDVSYYGVSVEDDRYVIYNGKNGYDLRTLLSYSNDIVKVKATIDATPKADPTNCIDKVGNYLVKITVVDGYDYGKAAVAKELFGLAGDGSVIYTGKAYVGETEAAELLGSTVEAYIAEDEDLNDWKLLAVVADGKTVVEETVSENLATATYSAGLYSYYKNADDRKMTEIDVATTGLKVYYNGVEVDHTSTPSNDLTVNGYSDLEDLLQAADSITFMGAKNAAYDKIFVTKYEYKVVKSVNADEKLIKFDPAGLLDLDAESRNDEDFIYGLYDADGKVVELADIAEGDVLNIVAPWSASGIDDAPYMDIYVTNETVTGAVEQYKSTTGKYTVAGTEYTSNVGLTLGEEGVFFLSIDGKIVKKEAATSISKNFALYLGSDVETKFGVSSYTLRLFTAEGKVDVAVAETVKIHDEANKLGLGTQVIAKSKNAGEQEALFGNGTTAEGSVTGAFTTLTADAAESTAKTNAATRFITYALDSNGKVKEIRVAAGSSSELVAMTANGSAKYDAEFEEFGGFEIGDAKLFIAPVEGTTSMSDWNVNTDKLAMGNFASLDEDDTFNSYLYTVSGDDVLSAALMTVRPSYGLEASPLAVVAAIGTVLDADDNMVTSLTLVQSGETKTVAIDYDMEAGDENFEQLASNIKDLKVGDVIQYAVNADEEIAEISVIYEAAARALTAKALGYDVPNDDMGFVFGVITEYADYIVLASDVDSNLKPTTSTKFKVADAEGATYAWYDEAAANNPVKKITVNGIRETVRANAVYAAVAKVNDKNRVEDIIVIALSNTAITNADEIACDQDPECAGPHDPGCAYTAATTRAAFDDYADINGATWELNPND